MPTTVWKGYLTALADLHRCQAEPGAAKRSEEPESAPEKAAPKTEKAAPKKRKLVNQ